MMRRLFAGVLALAFAGSLTGASEASTGGEASGAELGASYVAGPTRVLDPINDVAVKIPKGWYVAVPTLGIFGTTTIANYDMGHAEDWLPAHSSHVLLKEMAKIDMMTFDLGAAGSVEEWLDQRLSQGGMDEKEVSASRRVAVEVAGRRGVATVVRLGLSSKVEVALAWNEGKVVLASIAPLDTVDLGAALAIVDGIRDVRADRAHLSTTGRSHRFAPIQDLVRDELAVPGAQDDMPNINAAAGACNSWSGTDNGNCASGMSCAPDTTITLNLPFFYQTWWKSGGVGAFFGNYYHGNCNSDYYAIDFNQYSSSTCSSSLNDTGQRVYAAAAGTATVGYDAGGYGNYVLVSHSNGYKTRYAHLQSVAVSNNQSVTTQTIVGYVGDTGSATGAPHLHFSYQTSGVSFCNKSGGCPNGEAARSPQTRKPSPMQTNLGGKAMVDFGCYQAPP
jgi:hypothetical protein